MTAQIYGRLIDEESRCIHYKTKLDIVAMKCSKCNKYYACYQCHDELENHSFASTNLNNDSSVLCGKCNTLLSYDECKKEHCPNCGDKFNPKYKLHENIYFTVE